MTIEQWPDTLPTELLQRGYSQASSDVLLRSAVDVGPAKVRRRNTATAVPVAGNLLLSFDDLAILRAFYEDDLLDGTLRFSWADPVSLAAKEFRFTSPPKWVMASGWFDVTLELEILP